MGPTEPLGCQLYGTAPAKAITKSLHCFTHFLWHSDGSWGTVIIAVEVSCITYITRGKQKSKGKKCKTNKQIPSIKCTWIAPYGQISEGMTPHLGITIKSHSRNPGVRLAIFFTTPAVPMKQFRVWEQHMHGYGAMVFISSMWYSTRFLWYAVPERTGSSTSAFFGYYGITSDNPLPVKFLSST